MTPLKCVPKILLQFPLSKCTSKNDFSRDDFYYCDLNFLLYFIPTEKNKPIWAQGRSVCVIESLRGHPHLCERTGSFDRIDLSDTLLLQIRGYLKLLIL